MAGEAQSGTLEQFTHWATRAGATVEAVDRAVDARAAIAHLVSRLSATRVTATLEARPYAPVSALIGGTVTDVADADLGISVARLAVAETGSVLLGSNRASDRVVGMLAYTHVVIVPAAAIVETLDDAAPVLRRLTALGPEQLHYAGFITGPSRSADIERVITVGVQGARSLHLIIIRSTEW